MFMAKIKLFSGTSNELWIHINCNKINYLDYRYLQNCENSRYCIECCSIIFPFNSLPNSKNFLVCCTSADSNIMQGKDLGSDHNSSLLLKSSPNLEPLVNKFNSFTSANNNDPSSKYYDFDEMHDIKISRKKKSLFLIKTFMTFDIFLFAIKKL